MRSLNHENLCHSSENNEEARMNTPNLPAL